MRDDDDKTMAGHAKDPRRVIKLSGLSAGEAGRIVSLLEEPIPCEEP